jgi:inhibitor of KinA
MDHYPLGDQAVLARFADEADAFQFAHHVRQASFTWALDVVQAYASVAVYYDLTVTDYFAAARILASIDPPAVANAPRGRLFKIPCCYELGLDWPRLIEHTGLTFEEIVAFFNKTVHTVYAIGFCPGFPYMGYLPAPLAGLPRLASPRLRVEAGSVGITGKQAGIYTLPRPGGWNIVGRTPLELVNVGDGFFPLRTGDRVQFERIDEATFHKLAGQRLRVGERGA